MRILRISKEKMYISVAYDITWTKARNKVIKLLESYGFRVQKSVFEIMLNESQYHQLKKELKKILDFAKKHYEQKNIPSHDSIKIYILSKIGEGSLEHRIDGLGDGYEKVYIPDVIIA